MPFDPSLPQTNSPIASAELRDQFNGLKVLVDNCATNLDLNAAIHDLSDEVQDKITNETAGNVSSVADLSGLSISDPAHAQMAGIIASHGVVSVSKGRSRQRSRL